MSAVAVGRLGVLVVALVAAGLAAGLAVGLAMTAHAQSPAAPVAPVSPAVPHFVEETDSAGLNSRFEGEAEYMVGGGVATFDCDGDGLPEVYVTAGVNKARFYRNRSTRGGAIKLVEERSGDRKSVV